MRRLASLAMLGAIALTLTSCVGEPDGLRNAVPAGAGVGYAPAQPNHAPAAGAPMAPPPAGSGDLPGFPPQAMNTQEQPEQPHNIPGKQEVHSVVNANDCKRMDKAFRQAGRNLKLIKTVQNPDPNSPLRWTCFFQGSDATVGYFNDNRYNSNGEYQP
jgi:hypothetical protein